jgi:hypothetical protein
MVGDDESVPPLEMAIVVLGQWYCCGNLPLPEWALLLEICL